MNPYQSPNTSQQSPQRTPYLLRKAHLLSLVSICLLLVLMYFRVGFVEWQIVLLWISLGTISYYLPKIFAVLTTCMSLFFIILGAKIFLATNLHLDVQSHRIIITLLVLHHVLLVMIAVFNGIATYASWKGVLKPPSWSRLLGRRH